MDGLVSSSRTITRTISAANMHRLRLRFVRRFPGADHSQKCCTGLDGFPNPACAFLFRVAQELQAPQGYPTSAKLSQSTPGEGLNQQMPRTGLQKMYQEKVACRFAGKQHPTGAAMGKYLFLVSGWPKLGTMPRTCLACHKPHVSQARLARDRLRLQPVRSKSELLQ